MSIKTFIEHIEYIEHSYSVDIQHTQLMTMARLDQKQPSLIRPHKPRVPSAIRYHQNLRVMIVVVLQVLRIRITVNSDSIRL
jgi:hypothetical protein